MDGAIEKIEFEDVLIHSYTSPIDGFLVNSHLIETENSIVIIDGQLILKYASEVADYTSELAKPVDRILLTHAHFDHWLGLQELLARFPDVPIFALEENQTEIRVHGQTTIDNQQNVFGDSIASTPIVPNQVITTDEEIIDGLRYQFKKYVDAEAAIQVTISLPDLNVIIVGDLVYPDELNLFIITPHFENWIGILEDLKQSAQYDRILVGHGESTDLSVLDDNIQFLKTAKESYESTDTGEEYAKQLKETYPEREPENWINLSARLLYT